MAVLLMLPMAYYVKKARNIDGALDPKIIEDLKSDVVVVDSRRNLFSSEIVLEGSRSVAYENVGASIVTPARYNIKTFSDKDFKILGEAPWGLLNTVHSNLDDPMLVKYVFNNKIVNDSFMDRKDVAKIISDPKELYRIAQSEEELSKFFNYAAVKAALGNQKIVETIGASRIMDSVLRAPAAQYFIKNPKSSAQLINKSPTLSALKKNPGIVNAVKANRNTKDIASTILK